MKLLLFIFPIILFLVFIGIKLASPGTYHAIIQEDSVLEYAQALFYFLASIIALLVSVAFLRKKTILRGIIFGAFAVGFLFISLEEISWGQRIFKLESPGYFEQHNTQKEISLHNLDAVQPQLNSIYMAVGAWGTFAWLLVLPFVSKAKAKYRDRLSMVVPDWFLSPYFFFVFLIYTWFQYFAQPKLWDFLVWRDQEPAELLLSLGMLFFLVRIYTKKCSGTTVTIRGYDAGTTVTIGKVLAKSML